MRLGGGRQGRQEGMSWECVGGVSRGGLDRPLMQTEFAISPPRFGNYSLWLVMVHLSYRIFSLKNDAKANCLSIMWNVTFFNGMQQVVKEEMKKSTPAAQYRNVTQMCTAHHKTEKNEKRKETNLCGLKTCTSCTWRQHTFHGVV